jgi:hypothetical protein
MVREKPTKVISKVIYINLPADIAAKLAAEAKAEDRPISVQAGRIIRQYFDAKERAAKAGI